VKVLPNRSKWQEGEIGGGDIGGDCVESRHGKANRRELRRRRIYTFVAGEVDGVGISAAVDLRNKFEIKEVLQCKMTIDIRKAVEY